MIRKGSQSREYIDKPSDYLFFTFLYSFYYFSVCRIKGLFAYSYILYYCDLTIGLLCIIFSCSVYVYQEFSPFSTFYYLIAVLLVEKSIGPYKYTTSRA